MFYSYVYDMTAKETVSYFKTLIIKVKLCNIKVYVLFSELRPTGCEKMGTLLALERSFIKVEISIEVYALFSELRPMYRQFRCSPCLKFAFENCP